MAAGANDSNALWGRKWRITFQPANGGDSLILNDSDFGNYALKSTFNISRSGYEAIMRGDITIWNLNESTIATIAGLNVGFTKSRGKIIVEAGYEKGAFGQIFKGEIFQVRQIRENVVDTKTVIHCIDGMNIISNNYISLTFSAGTTQAQHIKAIAGQAQKPIEVGTITDDLSTVSLPRGKTFFGEPKKYFRQIAQANNGQFYAMDGKLNITKLSDPAAGEVIVVSPDTGLIGYPEQIDGGVQFTVLMDPRMKLVYPNPQIVRIDLAKTDIHQQQLHPNTKGTGSLPYILDVKGEYRIIKVTHRGDTRGNDWYTEVVGATQKGLLPDMIQNLPQSGN